MWTKITKKEYELLALVKDKQIDGKKRNKKFMI
jgi:hypothetical protein